MALKRLGTEHYIAIKWLALPKKGGKTIVEIAKEAGVHEQSIYNWKKDPLFESELKKEIVRNTLDRMPDIFESIPKHIIEDGNAAMFKTFLQAHGMLTDKLEVENKDNDKVIDRDDIKARLERLKAKDDGEE